MALDPYKLVVFSTWMITIGLILINILLFSIACVMFQLTNYFYYKKKELKFRIYGIRQKKIDVRSLIEERESKHT